MSIELLCTLGPASLNRMVIERLTQAGASLFRINLSHTAIADLAETIDLVRSHSDVPVCLDTEGAQIRTGQLIDGAIEIRDNAILRIVSHRVPGDATQFNLYPLDITRRLRTGDFLSIDFDEVLVQVVEVEADGTAVMRVLSGGRIGQNKGVSVDRPIDLPALTGKDRAAIAIGRDKGIRHYALSFANTSADVREIRGLAGAKAIIISKIECRNGLDNLDEIANESDALLVDRGDLSREIPLEQIPRTQKEIIRRVKALGRKVYVATNLLETMVAAPSPTRAEVNDIYTTLTDGANGLVLAAETAIGHYPIRCANMIMKMADEVQRGAELDDGHALDPSPFSMLAEPHGGHLINRYARPSEAADAHNLPAVMLDDGTVLDCTQIAEGTFSPLAGFMTRDQLMQVLDRHRLPDGTVWTMPVVLPLGEANGFAAGDRIALKDGAGAIRAVMDVADVFTMDVDELAGKWFGTTDARHPGVARLRRQGGRFAGGDILAMRDEKTSSVMELTPYQARFIFQKKGWTQVVGFHTRNVCHRAHEFIILKALERSGADGLLVSPVTGPKKANDFMPGPVMKSHQLLLDFGVYPRGRTVIGGFSTFPRYCGPREAVFTALCRKNMGCSHFIIGRDHTGVGDFYAPDANRRMFDALGDLGIAPMFFDTVGYNRNSGTFEERADGDGLVSISGTEVRAALLAGKRVPEWFLRDFIQDMLLNEQAAGRPLFSS